MASQTTHGRFYPPCSLLHAPLSVQVATHLVCLGSGPTTTGKGEKRKKKERKGIPKRPILLQIGKPACHWWRLYHSVDHPCFKKEGLSDCLGFLPFLQALLSIHSDWNVCGAREPPAPPPPSIPPSLPPSLPPLPSNELECRVLAPRSAGVHFVSHSRWTPEFLNLLPSPVATVRKSACLVWELVQQQQR